MIVNRWNLNITNLSKQELASRPQIHRALPWVSSDTYMKFGYNWLIQTWVLPWVMSDMYVEFGQSQTGAIIQKLICGRMYTTLTYDLDHWPFDHKMNRGFPWMMSDTYVVCEYNWSIGTKDIIWKISVNRQTDGQTYRWGNYHWASRRGPNTGNCFWHFSASIFGFLKNSYKWC